MIPELLHRIDRCPLSIFTLQSAGSMLKKDWEDDGAKPDEGEWQLADNHAFFLFLRYERRDCFQILSGAGPPSDSCMRSGTPGSTSSRARTWTRCTCTTSCTRWRWCGTSGTTGLSSPTVRQPLPMTPTHHPHISCIRPQHIFWTPAAEEDSRASRWPLPYRSAGSLCATRLPRR